MEEFLDESQEKYPKEILAVFLQECLYSFQMEFLSDSLEEIFRKGIRGMLGDT